MGLGAAPPLESLIRKAIIVPSTPHPSMGQHPLGVSRVELQEVILRGLPVTVVVSVTRVLLDPFHFSLPAGPGKWLSHTILHTVKVQK